VRAIVTAIRRFLLDIEVFSRRVLKRPLRSYQLAPARAIVESVIERKGLELAVVFARQAGKNELSAQVEAYLLNLFSWVRESSIVKTAPTYRPQLVVSKARLASHLDNVWNKKKWWKSEGYIYGLGLASVVFLTGKVGADVLGATASLLLEFDEAQSFNELKAEQEFAPMCAAYNTSRVYYGTIRTSNTYLSKKIKDLRRLEAQDGQKRVFMVPFDIVGKEVPAYKTFVEGEIRKKGWNHPIIKMEYRLVEIDSAGGMFDPRRQALMQGRHERYYEPRPGKLYAATLDVAGEDEAAGLEELARPGRDYTISKMYEVDLTTLRDLTIGAPTYRVVDVFCDQGSKHFDTAGASSVSLQLRAWYKKWGIYRLVADASGVGAGLTSYLAGQLGDEVVIPFKFSPPARKSKLGVDFLAVVETGRFQYFVDDGSVDWSEFWLEVEKCAYEVPQDGDMERKMRWGCEGVYVDDLDEEGKVVRRLVHDDRVMAAALVAELDGVEWPFTGESVVIEAGDVLERMDREEW
jgi:hypothetical protein